ncbi:MAG: glucokinase [Caldimicrobium sp.]|nr:glucokinase [Caldimicrobium sp.]MCX7872973.1 glucokinase [Caldimicrobium sp.]MDW8094592.1 ROK family protein [Caldimicrobium sp.]
MIDYSYSILIGDVGGTNSRLALFDPIKGKIFSLKAYKNREFFHFEDLLVKYLSEVRPSCQPKEAIFALAGPVIKNKATITNLGWEIGGEKLRRKFNLKRVYLVNDLEAMAGSVKYLRGKDLFSIRKVKKTRVSSSDVKAFMAIGTGVGISLLISLKPLKILSTEGGHSPFSPADGNEWRFIEFLKSMDREITWEEALSGRGLSAWYEYLYQKKITPEEITTLALQGEKEAREVILLYFRLLGRKCYEVAVYFKPLGGIYLAGGVLAGLKEFFNQKEYLQRFEEGYFHSKKLKELLELIPIELILHPYPVLLGVQTIIHSQQGR